MANQPDTTEAPKKKNIKFILVFVLLIIAGLIFGTVKYLHSLKHESTDDAQIDADISPVIPRVPGYVKDVFVKDNQFVHKGDTLLILDDRDFVIKEEAAEAMLAAAQSQLNTANAGIPVVDANINSSKTNINTIDAQIATAQVNVGLTTKNLERYQNLINDHSITQQQFEQAQAAKEIADHQLQIYKAQKNSAQSQTTAVSTQKNVSIGHISSAAAAVKQAQANLDAAKLSLSYTVITASVDGQVSNINLQPGQLLQAGQALFDIVPDNQKWIVANFKETQLTKMKIGQKVSIKVDAFPNQELMGTVTSFSPATGAKFSLLPPDNASGNFVKVVQRIPVRIDFEKGQKIDLDKLKAGMNVDIDVHLQ